MTIRYDRPVSRSAFLARRLGRAAAVFLVLVVLLHRFGPLTTPDFVALALASAVPAALAVPFALFGLWRLWKVGALGGVAAARALLYAALPLGLIGFSAFQYMTRPMLYDVSTDPVDPPAWISVPAAKQQWLERPPVTSAMRQVQAGAYPGLTGRRYEGALDRVHEAVLKVAELTRLTVTASRGHEVLQPELMPLPQGRDAPAPAETVPDVGPVPLPRPAPQELAAAEPPEPAGTARIQAETRTLVLGLAFDVMIRLREEAETTLVDVRVASRYGPHDLGIGAAIAEHYLHELDAELLGVAGD